MGLTDFTEREELKLMAIEYTVEDTGSFLSEPIVELFCRDRHGERQLIEVEGYYPYLYISEAEYKQNEKGIFTESMVRSVVAREGITSDDYSENAALTETDTAPKQTLKGRKLVKIHTVTPGDVGDLRDAGIFEHTWEADVFFTNRFLIDSGIKRGLTVPRGDDRVHYNDIEATDDTFDLLPRIATIDIEVWSGNEFPDTQDPKKPITAVTVHDSYDDEYVAGVLHPEATHVNEHDWDDVSWELPDGVDECEIGVYHNEAEMLGSINEWIIEKDPDLLTGWNSSSNEMGSGFDYPYWINRCRRINEWTVDDLSYENGKSFVSSYGSAVIGGREMFDMLQAYKKTQIHEKRSYSLEYIAGEELGYGKEDIGDLDTEWAENPATFMKYNIRDVEAVVEIERSKNVLEMYDHIRSIAGATFNEIADSNIGIIDMLYLREASNRGVALPTSTEPDVQHYWGAYVFPPSPGKHKNVVYPDLSSLYPNLFRDMNASPETIIGFEEDLEDSKYSKEDCHTVYVDTRGEQQKRDADEPERTELFVLKPEVRESFVRDVIGDLIDMKYEYKKDEYADEAYEAVKRITNSVYGCMGDSVSYGKGFRLFDWRIAEAITLAGRDVIKYTADTFESRVRDIGYTDAEIISGDTDSCVCKIESADGTWESGTLQLDDVSQYVDESNLNTVETPMAETLLVSMEAANYVDSTYPEYMKERFNIEDGNMAVEIESYAQAALFFEKKKRYAQWVRWDEGELVDEIEYTGLELVRSDSSEVTERVQERVIEIILKNDNPKELLHDYLQEQWELVSSGDVPIEEIGKPSAFKNDLWDYGYAERDYGYQYYTPQPHIRGSRYAIEFIDGEDIKSAKPLMYYCDGVKMSSDLPPTYCYENKLNCPADDAELAEEGRELDAIAVEEPQKLPDGIIIDYEKMANKTIRDPIEPIAGVMGMNFDDLITEGKQSGLSEFM